MLVVVALVLIMLVGMVLVLIALVLVMFVARLVAVVLVVVALVLLVVVRVVFVFVTFVLIVPHKNLLVASGCEAVYKWILQFWHISVDFSKCKDRRNSGSNSLIYRIIRVINMCPLGGYWAYCLI